jgi:hypothetical protein
MNKLFLAFFIEISTTSAVIGISEEPRIVHQLTQDMKHNTYTEQIFKEIAAIKQVLEYKIAAKATGCSEQTYVDPTTHTVHQEFRNGTGVYEIIFYEDGSVVIDTRYISTKAPIVEKIDRSWSKNCGDTFSKCTPHNAVYPVSCKTTLSQPGFNSCLFAVQQAQAINK